MPINKDTDKRINGIKTIIISLLLLPFFPPAYLSFRQFIKRIITK